jgi:hypothetical protein
MAVPLGIVAGDDDDPGLFFNGNDDTGLYQADPGSDKLDITTGGVHTASFGADGAGLDVVNDLKAGRVEAGHGKFYTAAQAGQFLGQARNSDVSNLPQHSFVDEPNTGLGYRTDNDIMYMYIEGEPRLQFVKGSTGYTSAFRPFRLYNFTEDDLPALSFQNDNNTGIFQNQWTWGSNSGRIGFASQGSQVAEFDGRGLVVDDTVRAGRVESGTGTFYTSLTVGDERADDSVIEFYDEAALAYTLGFDESATAFKLASGVFDDTNDMLTVTEGDFDFRGNSIQAGSIQAGYGDFYTRLTAGTKFWVADDIILMQPNGLTTIAPDGRLRLQSVSDKVSLQSPTEVTCNAPFRGIYESTAAVPGYSFTADTDTGVFRETANILGFTTGGTEAGRFDADQNLHVLNDVKASRVHSGYGTFYTATYSRRFLITPEEEELAYDVGFGWADEGYSGPVPSSYTGLYRSAAGTPAMSSEDQTVQSWHNTKSVISVPLDIAGDLTMTSGQILAQDGTEELPGWSFADDPDTGLRRSGSDDMTFTAGGVDQVMIGEEYTGFVYPAYFIETNGSVTIPSIAWWNDYQTGLYQAVSLSGNVDFSSKGEHAASIGIEGITVVNDVMAGRVESGWGHFYIDATAGRFFAGPTVGEHLSKPQYSFANQTNTGMSMNDTTTGLYLNVSGNWKMFMSTSKVQLNVPIQIDDDSTAGNPALQFRDDVTTGIFQIANGDHSIAFSTDGTQAGYFDTSQRLYLSDVVRAGAGSEGVPTYTFSGDNNSGMYGPGANRLAFVTGGADALVIDPSQNLHATNDIYGENDLHVANSMDAQHGFFYTSLHIGGSSGGGAGPDQGTMWKIRQEEGSEDLEFVAPNSPDTGPYPELHLNTAVNLWQDMPDVTGGISTICMIDPEINMTGGQSGLAAIGISPDVNFSAGLVQGYDVLDTSTWNSIGGMSFSIWALFSANLTFITSTAAAKLISPVIFNSAPTFTATNVTSDNLSTFNLYPRGFAAMPALSTTGAGGHLSFVNFSGYESGMAMAPAHADGSIHIDIFNDFSALPVTATGPGEETIGVRNMFLLNASSIASELNGIRSYVGPSTDGKQRLFINHTGGADSVHVGDFYVRSMLSADTIQLTGGYVDGYVKPFVSLLKTDVQDIGGDDTDVTLVTWNVQEHIDPTFTHDTGSNPSRITINHTGRYSISSVIYGQRQGGDRITLLPGIKIDGGTTDYRGGIRSYSRGISFGKTITPAVMTERQLTAGSYIEIELLVDQADNPYVVNTGDIDSELIIRKIS